MISNNSSELDKINSDAGVGGKVQILCIIAGLLIGFFVFRGFAGGGEDNWIKDSKGIYIPQGYPSSVPDGVKAQHDSLDCALKLYISQKPANGYNSECLGVCGDYAVDVVHTPKNANDNKQENQCSAYLDGQVKSFIEIDGNGNVVKIG